MAPRAQKDNVSAAEPQHICPRVRNLQAGQALKHSFLFLCWYTPSSARPGLPYLWALYLGGGVFVRVCV